MTQAPPLHSRVPTPCRDPRRDPDDWYADARVLGARSNRQADAKRLCWTRCTVRARCLEVAMWFEETTPDRSRYGVWGGYTARERGALFRLSQRPTAEPDGARTGDPPALAA